MRNSLFTYDALLGLAQNAIFTLHEGTSDLNTKGFSGGMGNMLGRMFSRSLILFLQGAVADCALSSPVSQRNSTPATQLSQFFIQQSRMTLLSIDLTMMLFQWSLEIIFPAKVCTLGKTG